MKPPRIVPSRRANIARLLRFAPALRVTARRAPVVCSYGRKVRIFRPSLRPESPHQPVGLTPIQHQPDRTTHLLRNPDKLTC